ncbi:hypothetical protein [Pendulispora albinea]|uniref:Secreted protein n=1 Tax=Pendulispora albinea TaxID=2741071 RepID=A0ABZ2LM52_9BACT
MKRNKFAGMLLAILAGLASVLTTAPASADIALIGGESTRLAFGDAQSTRDRLVLLGDVPDDQVVCYVGASLPSWGPRPTAGWTFDMQCNGRWVRGSLSMYLWYRFSANDSWTLATKNEFIPLNGGNSSTRIMQGLHHTLPVCFPAYWVGVATVEVTFYAGSPITERAAFQTVPEQFLGC